MNSKGPWPTGANGESPIDSESIVDSEAARLRDLRCMERLEDDLNASAREFSGRAARRRSTRRNSPTEEIEHLADELQRHVFDLIVPLQTTRDLNLHAFDAAEDAARELARTLKGSTLLPRKCLHLLDMAAQTLESAALYAKDSAFVQQMAMALRGTLTLIIWGECHDDYKSRASRLR